MHVHEHSERPAAEHATPLGGLLQPEWTGLYDALGRVTCRRVDIATPGVPHPIEAWSAEVYLRLRSALRAAGIRLLDGLPRSATSPSFADWLRLLATTDTAGVHETCDPALLRGPHETADLMLDVLMRDVPHLTAARMRDRGVNDPALWLAVHAGSPEAWAAEAERARRSAPR